MVRVKHRYLLATFLYPGAVENASSKDPVPDILQFNQPSCDRLDVPLLLRAIREGVAELFGDYGAGVISTSLKSKRIQKFRVQQPC
jgi:ribonuclease P/MRP protein subunit POP5